MSAQVLVLNADYRPINAVDWKRAVCLVIKDKAEILASTTGRIGRFPFPRVIRLLKRVKAMIHRWVPWSRFNVYLRDQNRCQYCGRLLHPSERTVDHVLPRSRGGENRWVNTVTACFPCNNRKGDRTPEEAEMQLSRIPYQPRVLEFLTRRLADNAGLASDVSFYLPSTACE